MKSTPIRQSLFWLAALMGLSSLAAAQHAASPIKLEVRTIKIADGIYEFMSMDDGYVEQLNSVAVINDRDVLVFDTTTRPSTARMIVAEVRKITDKPVRYVVNSHWHPDHWSGNEVFAQEFPGVEIIATEQAKQYMINVAPAWPPRFQANVKRLQAAFDAKVSSGKQEDGSPFTDEERRKEERDIQTFKDFVEEAVKVHRTYPTLTYVDKLEIDHGGRQFRFMSMVGDAEGSTVLYLPKERLLMTGDVVVFPLPYSTPPPKRRVDTLKALAAMDIDTIIPGHGPAQHDKSYINQLIELIDAVAAQTRAALQAGAATLDEVQKAVHVEAIRAKFTHGDRDLEGAFDGQIKNLIRQSIREAREQDYQ